MHIRNIVFKAFPAALICLLMTHNACAENNFASTAFRQQANTDLFQLPDVQEVFNKFCRSLEIDQKNKTDQQILNEIAGHADLSAKQRSQVFLLQDLLEFNKDLTRRVSYLTTKRDLLKSQLIASGNSGNVFLEGLNDIERNMSATGNSRSFYFPSVFARNDPLVLVYRILHNEKDRLLARVEYLQEQYRWLKIAKSDTEDGLSAKNFVQYSNVVVPRISSYKIKNEPMPPQVTADNVVHITPESITLAKEEDDIKVHTLEGDFSKGQLGDLKHNLEQKDRKINDLSKQVVDLSLKISEIERLLNERAESTDHLKAELDESRQRFMLEKRIIQEKNTEIQLLQDSLEQLKRESKSNNNIAYSRDEKLIELNGMLEIYKYKLKEKNRLAKEKTRELTKAHNDLFSLKDRLASLESELSELMKNSQQNELQDPEIEGKIQDLHSKFKDIQYFFLENFHDSDRIKTYPRIESSNLSR